jgi:glyoxylase-like metal-dependent hydrolase (beta-lactamase superfamily II)
VKHPAPWSRSGSGPLFDLAIGPQFAEGESQSPLAFRPRPWWCVLGALSLADNMAVAKHWSSRWLVVAALVRAGCAENGAALANDSDAAEPAEQLKVHTVTASPQGILVNAYVVETKNGLVVVDSALTVSDARALRTRVDELGKPLLGVVLTHGHPDHYNGVAALVADRDSVPIYATAGVDGVIRESDAAKEQQWRPMFGDEWPAPRAFPTRIVNDGEELVLDGIHWRVHAIGPGESHADAYWSAAGSDGTSFFVGDVVMHGVHAYLSDGHSAAWLANLLRLRPILAGARALYPGHGMASGVELLDWQRGYLEAYRAAVEELRAGASSLSEAAKQALTERMKAQYPNAGLEFLIPLGADSVAAELSR